MKKHFSAVAILVLQGALLIQAQDKPAPRPALPANSQTGTQTGFDLSASGVRIQPDPRLIVMMAALDAAGFDPTPQGQEPSPFRAQIRREQQDLDPDLRHRMHVFFERNNKSLVGATPAEQAARYVSLVYALGPPPSFEAPARTDDLPGGLLDVLDFAPLMREFYRKSGIDERLPDYLRKYQAEGDRLRPAAIDLVRKVVFYLHTKPVTTVIERVPVTNTSNKKNGPVTYRARERERRFFIVPDLLAVPGTINLRVIAEDYYVIVPFGINPASSELRRAYIRYVIDPIILRNNRDVTGRRAHIKALLDERIAAKEDLSPDIFIAMMRSLVAATDVRIDYTARIEAATREAQTRIAKTTDPTLRESIKEDLKQQTLAASDEAKADLAEAYERGAVLAFFFAEQLEGIETSGFDIANFFADMMATFDPVRESRRLADNAEARKRALDARKSRQAQMTANANSTISSRQTEFLKAMAAADDLLRVKNYAEAERHLLLLMQEYKGEPRIFFALGQAASLSAEDATDEDVQRERLNRSLTHYRLAINAASADTEPALIQRAYAALGRIFEFLENREEARQAFDAAIKIGPVDRNAFDEATKGKARLAQQK